MMILHCDQPKHVGSSKLQVLSGMQVNREHGALGAFVTLRWQHDRSNANEEPDHHQPVEACGLLVILWLLKG